MAVEFADFIQTFGHAWDEEPPQPPDCCVDHLMSMILRTVDVGAGKLKGVGALSDMEVTENKAKRFATAGRRKQQADDDKKS